MFDWVFNTPLNYEIFLLVSVDFLILKLERDYFEKVHRHKTKQP